MILETQEKIVQRIRELRELLLNDLPLGCNITFDIDIYNLPESIVDPGGRLQNDSDTHREKNIHVGFNQFGS